MTRRMRMTSLLAGAAVAASVLPAAAAPPTTTPNRGGDGASTTAAATIGAPELWDDGVTGDGVGIALIDTGVSPRPDLKGRIVGQVDTSGEARKVDGHGHGTFLAGLMVGQDGPDGPTGVAPGAHVVSYKVADRDGRTTLTSLVTATTLIEEMADDLDLGVVVLALGGPVDDIPDPLETALERLWDQGLVVVVASGNTDGEITEPGVSPWLLTVGATDDRGTADRADDVEAPWSGEGQGRDGSVKPEVRAPGTSLVSTRVPASDADREHPTSRIEGQWFRGSGTSMAAAVVGGAAALLLDAEPGLSPDEVKGRLMASADEATGTIHLPSALAAEGAAANTSLPELDFVDTDAAPTDEMLDEAAELELRPGWETRNWITRNWIDQNWETRNWITRNWIDQNWETRNWITRNWITRNWITRNWISVGWDGQSWVTRNWIDQEWAETSWITRNWITRNWVDGQWAALP